MTELTPANNTQSDTVTVGPGADLEVTLVSSFPAEVDVGEPQLFRVFIRNNGPEPATGVEVQLDLAGSDGQIDSFETTNWNCNDIAATCTLPTTLQPNQLLSESVFVNISYASSGTKSLTAMVTGSEGDPNLSNNADTAFVDVIEVVDELFSDGFEG